MPDDVFQFQNPVYYVGSRPQPQDSPAFISSIGDIVNGIIAEVASHGGPVSKVIQLTAEVGIPGQVIAKTVDVIIQGDGATITFKDNDGHSVILQQTTGLSAATLTSTLFGVGAMALDFTPPGWLAVAVAGASDYLYSKFLSNNVDQLIEQISNTVDVEFKLIDNPSGAVLGGVWYRDGLNAADTTVLASAIKDLLSKTGQSDLPLAHGGMEIDYSFGQDNHQIFKLYDGIILETVAKNFGFSSVAEFFAGGADGHHASWDDGQNSNFNLYYESGGHSWVFARSTDTLNVDTDGDSLTAPIAFKVDDVFAGLSVEVGNDNSNLIIGTDGNDTELNGGKGEDYIYGGKGEDKFVGGEGKDHLYGGDNIDTADYNNDPAGITITWKADGTIQVKDGWGTTDTLDNIEKIIGKQGAVNTLQLNGSGTLTEPSPGHFIFNSHILDLQNVSSIKGDTATQAYYLHAPSGLSVDGGGGSDYAVYDGAVIQKQNTDGTRAIYDNTGTYQDKLTSVTLYYNAEHQVMDDQHALSPYYNAYVDHVVPNYDYSALSGAISVTFESNAYRSVDSSGLHASYTYDENINVSLSSGLTYTADLANRSGFTEGADNAGFGQYISEIREASTVTITGSNHGDTYDLSQFLGVAILNTGTGNDTINYGDVSWVSIIYSGGIDVVQSDTALFGQNPGIAMEADITPDQVTVSYDGSNLVLNVADHGSLTVDNFASYQTVYFQGGGSITFDSYTPVFNNNYSLNVTIDGSWGNDVWTGHGDRNETYYAFSGNDILNGSTGNNHLYGGDGNDTYVYDGQGGNSVLTDASGQDIILISDANIHAADVGYTRNGEDLTLGFNMSGSDANGLPIYSATMTIAGFYGANNTISTLRFSDGELDIDLNAGQAFKTMVIGSDESDVLDISGSVANSFIYGLDGDDTINAGSGGDTIYGGSGDDIIYGNESDDILDGGSGANYLNGGFGNDTYILSGAGFSALEDHDGVNRIYVDQLPPLNFDDTQFGFYLNNLDNQAYASIVGSFSTITFFDHSVVSLNDILTGNNVYYQPTDGDDTITPWENGTVGDFAIDLLGGNDVYSGWAGTDIVNGGDGYDNISGGLDADYLSGGNDGDNLDGGQGNDVLDGGEGDDTANYSGDFDGVTGINIDLSQGVATNDGYGTRDTLISIEDVIGSHFNDVITGSTGNNQLYGIDGSDVINGLAGSDYIEGGQGNDLLNGGLDNDTYAFYLGDGSGDVITDDGGNDKIYIGNNLTIDDVTFSRVDDDLVINYGDAVTVKDFYSGEASKIIEQLSFSDYSTFDLTSLLIENTTPIAQEDNFTAIINQATTGNVLANNGHGADLDADSNTLSVTSLSVLSTNGIAVTLSSNGDFTYTPTVDFVGTDSFTYTISDGHGGTDTASVTMTYGPPLEEVIGTSDDDYLSDEGIASSLVAGEGNDTYEVNNAYTVVVEGSDSGYDGVNASVSFTLGDNVEYIYLTGSGNINATGNSLTNYMVGNNGNNIIIGGAGDDTLFDGGGIDTLIGGADNDQYNITNSAVTIVELSDEGYDNVDSSVTYVLPDNVEGLWLSGSDSIDATGNASDNYIVGNLGNNILIGGEGNDTLIDNGGVDILIGGAGDDLYNIGNVAVSLIELNDEGYDTIDSTVTYTIPDNIESIWLGGEDDINATGNASDNYIVGNSGDNTLSGGDGNDTLIGNGGADILIGGEGDDLYQVTDSHTVITENIGEGYDEVDSSVSFILSSNLDSLWLGGEDDINGAGNALDNYIVGNGANNVLDGGSGDDTLYGEAGDDIIIGNSGSNFINGGEGADTFKFVSASASDTIGDFSISDGDKLDISQLLEGYDPLSSAIADFVKITESDGNSILSINAQGTGVSADYQAQATLNGVTGITDLSALLTDNHLIAS